MRATVCPILIYFLEFESQTPPELGLLIWQDFQMTCGIYPGKDDFPESFQAEAEDNIRRLRHHPSLVLFCGGNENYKQIHQRSKYMRINILSILTTMLRPQRWASSSHHP